MMLTLSLLVEVEGACRKLSEGRRQLSKPETVEDRIAVEARRGCESESQVAGGEAWEDYMAPV